MDSGRATIGWPYLWRAVSLLAGISFGLHLVWENLQAPLFAGYVSFGQHFLLCLWGTGGDVAITLSVWALIALLKRDAQWLRRLEWRDAITLGVIGLAVALGIEYRALALGRWGYAPSMPIIPYLQVGLLPVIQMTLFLPLTMYLTKRVLRD